MHISYTIINCIRMGRGGDGGLDRFAPDHQVTRDTRNRRISSRPNRVAQRSAVFNDVILYTSFRHRLSLCVCAVLCASRRRRRLITAISNSSSFIIVVLVLLQIIRKILTNRLKKIN